MDPSSEGDGEAMATGEQGEKRLLAVDTDWALEIALVCVEKEGTRESGVWVGWSDGKGRGVGWKEAGSGAGVREATGLEDRAAMWSVTSNAETEERRLFW